MSIGYVPLAKFIFSCPIQIIMILSYKIKHSYDWFNIMNQGPQNYGSADLKDSDRETALSRHQINLT